MMYVVIVDPSSYEVEGGETEFYFEDLKDAFAFIETGLKANNRVEFGILYAAKK